MSLVDRLVAIHGTATTTGADATTNTGKTALRITGPGIVIVDGWPYLGEIGDYVVDGKLIKAAELAGKFIADAQPMLLGTTPLSGAAINLLTTSTTGIVGLPIDANRRIQLLSLHFAETARTGTATGTLTYNVGTNSPNFDNIIAAGTVSAAAFNATTYSVPFELNAYPASAGMPLMGSPPSLRISGALGGASVLTGRLGMACRYV